VYDGVLIEVFHGGHDAVFEFLFGCDADMTKNGASEFREEAFDEIEPGAVLARGPWERNAIPKPNAR
jgi:hypothetical protein